MIKQYTNFKPSFTSKYLVILLLTPIFSWALTIGTITAKPSKKVKRYELLASYIEKRLGEDVKIKFAKDIPHMQMLIEEGKVDIFIDSVYPSLKVCIKAGCEPLLLRWKNGVKYYHTLIFTRKDSELNSLRDLVGKKLALDEPFSTSGYFVPVALLLERGFKLVELKSPSDPVPEDSIGYVFAGEEENVVGWVFLKKTDAGALYDIKFESIVKDKKHFFKILFVSPDIPRHLVNFSSKLSKAKVDKLIDILTSMHRDTEGRRVLHEFKKTLKFERLSEKDRKLIDILKKKMLTFGL